MKTPSSSEPLETVEKTFDEMTLFVERPVDLSAFRPAAVSFDLRRSSQLFHDEPAQGVGVVSGIGDDMADAFQPGQQPLCLGAVGPLPGGQFEPDRQAERINGGVDLRRQTATGTADRTSLKPPFCELASA